MRRAEFVVCDGVQLPGRIDLAAATSGADFLFLSAHKFGGPKGAGALIAMRPDLSIEAPLLRGGGQERGARAGTENVAAIAGFGAAARLAAAEAGPEATRLAALRDRLEQRVRETAPEAVVFGAAAPRLPNTLAFAAPGVAAATLLIALDLAGVAVSSGSACSSGKVTPSHVLAAMGVEPGSPPARSGSASAGLRATTTSTASSPHSAKRWRGCAGAAASPDALRRDDNGCAPPPSRC